MTVSPNPDTQPKTILESGKDYIDTAIQAAKDHPAAAAGIAAGVAAVAAGAAYGASRLRSRETDSLADTGENADIIDPQRVPEALPIEA